MSQTDYRIAPPAAPEEVDVVDIVAICPKCGHGTPTVWMEIVDGQFIHCGKCGKTLHLRVPKRQ